jgi:hypothetical protein
VETMVKPSASDRIYRPTKLAAIVDTLSEDGFSSKEVLRGVGMGADELHSPDTLDFLGAASGRLQKRHSLVA